MDKLADGSMPEEIISKRVNALHARDKELQAIVDAGEEPPPLLQLHPNLALTYRQHVTELHEALPREYAHK